MNLFKNSVLGVSVVEELAIGTVLVCFAAVCVGLAPERAQPVASPSAFYRAVDRVCAQVEEGDTSEEQRSLAYFLAVKVDSVRKVLKGATGVRAMPGNAVSAREEFLTAARRVVEAGQRFQEEGYRWTVSMGMTDEALTELGKLARRRNLVQCEALF